ncbi:hypothetical protein A6A04_09490 [Paramagnetospirillum marisnigri]|uniref:DUF1127 domain-containing protein n=2 Tax=Paramagnetospirillum marisnigri TaxID=1285242 RepID=A0A178M3V9_9PROT|nr:hypothetical protein A6A04_09490 [Paramagnetospirillum marisnigri]
MKSCSPLDVPAASGRGLISALRGSRLVRRLEVLAARRALKAELDRLDHRELHDLGIDAAGVDGFVASWTPAWKN